MLIDICIKFCEYSLSGFQVIEPTRFVTDRQTDIQTERQTDAPGKTVCHPTLKGGDIIMKEGHMRIIPAKFRQNPARNC